MRKKVFLLLILLILLLSVSVQGSEGVLAAHEIKTSECDTFRYLLYTPEIVSEKLPLIVYLHGGSGKGEDLSLITSVEGFPQFVAEGKIADVPAYIVFPQISSSFRGWAEAKQSVKELIGQLCAELPIDETRVSLTGHSMGGTGAWSLALAYPELFSAVAPMSGSVKTTEKNLAKLANTPVWAFVGSADTVVSPDTSQDFVAALKEENAEAAITVLEGATHFDVPSLAYLDAAKNVIGWLISNARENNILGADCEKVSMRVEVPGNYCLVFAEYDALGKLSAVKFAEQSFSFGKTQLPVPDGIALSAGDKVFLLQSEKPLCRAWTVK